MIKIKLYELDKHRNECTFRPYIAAQHVLHDIGIEFTQGDSYDYAWVAQASFMDKKVSLEQSVNDGLEFLSKITGDYMLLDGQDSTSLLGSYEVFKESNAVLLLKNSLLKNRSLYKQGSRLGRYYWGPGDYKLDDIDDYSERIVLSGTNWLSTHWAGINVQWHQIDRPRKYDVSAMFQYPSKEISYEYGIDQTKPYDDFRTNCIQQLDKSSRSVAKLENGERVSQREYFQRMYDSKIIVAPYGYGEMAPRDLEATMFGSVLIKPDMSYIDTKPNVFIDNETYIACKHDFSDLSEKIEEILGDHEQYSYIVNSARAKYIEVMNPQTLAMNVYTIFKQLDGVE
jgi:hypothetical protein